MYNVCDITTRAICNSQMRHRGTRERLIYYPYILGVDADVGEAVREAKSSEAYSDLFKKIVIFFSV